MKPIQILRSHQRAQKAVQKKQTQFVLTLISIVAILAVAFIFLDPVNAFASTKVFFGASSLAILVPWLGQWMVFWHSLQRILHSVTIRLFSRIPNYRLLV